MYNPKSEIAATAAALVVEEGLEYGAAKRRAIKQLALPARTGLPGNDELEDAVRDYIAVFCADTQPVELAALRGLALVWMERMAAFRPHLAGAVWHKQDREKNREFQRRTDCPDTEQSVCKPIHENLVYLVTGYAKNECGIPRQRELPW